METSPFTEVVKTLHPVVPGRLWADMGTLYCDGECAIVKLIYAADNGYFLKVHADLYVWLDGRVSGWDKNKPGVHDSKFLDRIMSLIENSSTLTDFYLTKIAAKAENDLYEPDDDNPPSEADEEPAFEGPVSLAEDEFEVLQAAK